MSFDLMVSKSPFWIRGLPPVVKAKHDGEGAGRQHLFFVLVLIIQAVSRRQCKSVADLFDNDGYPTTNQKVCCIALFGEVRTKTLLHLLLM